MGILDWFRKKPRAAGPGANGDNSIRTFSQRTICVTNIGHVMEDNSSIRVRRIIDHL